MSDEGERYWRWARKVVEHYHGPDEPLQRKPSTPLEAGAFFRLFGTSDQLQDAIEALDGARISTARLRWWMDAADAYETLLEGDGMFYNAEADALKVRTEGRPWFLVSVAVGQVWERYAQQADNGHRVYQGTHLEDADRVPDEDSLLVGRVRATLSKYFPPHLLTEDRIKSAIRNHRGDRNNVDVPGLPKWPERH